jgi:hypothetical protein
VSKAEFLGTSTLRLPSATAVLPSSITVDAKADSITRHHAIADLRFTQAGRLTVDSVLVRRPVSFQ